MLPPTNQEYMLHCKHNDFFVSWCIVIKEWKDGYINASESFVEC